MKNWLKFIFIPFVIWIICIFVGSFLVGFDKEYPYSNFHYGLEALTFFITGAAICYWAPSKNKLFTAIPMATLYGAYSLYQAITTHKTTIIIEGRHLYYEFIWQEQLAVILGLVFAIIIFHKDEDEQSNNDAVPESDSSDV